MKLTSKQRTVLAGIADGKRITDINREMWLSPAGAQFHVRALLKKGAIRRVYHGRYELTDAGRAALNGRSNAAPNGSNGRPLLHGDVRDAFVRAAMSRMSPADVVACLREAVETAQ